MANNPANRERNRWMLSLLDLKPQDRVLEIGFGPGVALNEVSKIVTQGGIFGVDHSELMLDQAGKRNAAAVREGRIHLLLGSAMELPAFAGRFDKIFSANSVQFWKDADIVFQRLAKLLNPGGIIATTYQPRHSGATDRDALEMGNKIVSSMRKAGFSQIRLESKAIKPVLVVCVLGTVSDLTDIKMAK